MALSLRCGGTEKAPAWCVSPRRSGSIPRVARPLPISRTRKTHSGSQWETPFGGRGTKRTGPRKRLSDPMSRSSGSASPTVRDRSARHDLLAHPPPRLVGRYPTTRPAGSPCGASLDLGGLVVRPVVDYGAVSTFRPRLVALPPNQSTPFHTHQARGLTIPASRQTSRMS